ncbi:MAG: hypothetical protein ACE5NM_10255 [Sedimentisphaerales bacterium]
MTQRIDLKAIERKTRMALHQDGLDEILVGLSLGIMAIFFLDFRLSIAMIAGCAIQILLKPACRRRITYPRVGYAKLPEPKDKATGRKIFVLAIVLVLIGAGLFFVSQLRWLLPLYLGIVLAGVTFAQVRRTATILDYSVAALFLISGLIGLWLVSLGYDPGKATAIQGWCLAAILILTGIVRFTRFLRKYPKPAKEVSDGKE